MTKRQMPSGRKSKLDVVVVKPFGPHHCVKCSALVQAENTSSRGASYSRMPTITRGSRSRSRLLVAAMLFTLCLRFGLQLFQIGIEAVEALLEEAAVVLEPVVDVLERLWLDPAGSELRFAAACDQAGTFQD